MLGLFFRNKKEKERVAPPKEEEAPAGGKRCCSSAKDAKNAHNSKEGGSPGSPMKRPKHGAEASPATAAGAAAAGPSDAHHHHHHHHHRNAANAAAPPSPARRQTAPTRDEAALLAEVAQARKALSADPEIEPEVLEGLDKIRTAVHTLTELRARAAEYGAANDAASPSGKQQLALVLGRRGGAAATSPTSPKSPQLPFPLTAKQKLELNELGLRAQLALDGVETGGRQEVRALRKRATVAAERFLDEVQAAREAEARPTPPTSPRGG
jgi:hypothetical protein